MLNKCKLLVLPFAILLILSACQLKSINFTSKASTTQTSDTTKPSDAQASTTQSADTQAASAQGENKDQQGPSEQSSQTSESGTAKGTEKSINPSKQLDEIQTLSANIVFDVIKLDWNNAQERLKDIKQDMDAIRPSLTSASVPAELIDGINNTVNDLEKDIASKKVFETKSDANKITKFIPDIQDSCKIQTPTDMGRIAYFAREIHINVNHGDWTSAKSNFNSAKEVWARLKPNLSGKYKLNTEKLDSVILKTGKAVETKNSSSTVTDTNILLDNLNILKWDIYKQIKS